jgi:hypothetical protein
MDFFKPLKTPDTHRWNFEILHRVLLILSRIIENEANRSLFVSQQTNIQIIAQILQTPASYPEDVVMAAGLIVTLVSSKGSKNPYSGSCLKLILSLYKLFPTHSYVHNLLAMILDSLSKNNDTRPLITSECTGILMNFVKDSRVKEVLVHSLAALANLSSAPDGEIVRGVVRNKIIQPLLGLLKLAQTELTRSITTILAAVAEQSESGLVEIAKKGTPTLVQLLSDDDALVQEKTLATILKLLKSENQHLQIFLQLEGERPLLDCILSPNEGVNLPALTIIEMISTTAENRELLRDAGIEECLTQALATLLPKSNAGILARKLHTLYRQDSGKDEKTDLKRQRTYWLKVVYHTTIKLIPIREPLTFRQFLSMIKSEFNVEDWDRITTRVGIDEVEITDQRTLNWIINQLNKDKPVQVDIQIKSTDNSSASKMDTLLQRLTHKQLRVLLRDAIDKEAELRDAITQFITQNRVLKQSAKEERLSREPYGGMDDAEFLQSQQIQAKEVSSTSEVYAASATSASSFAPPPPPPSGGLSLFNKGKPNNKPVPGDLMEDIKNALRFGNLKRTEVGNEKLGINRDPKPEEAAVLQSEDAEAGTRLWHKDPHGFADQLAKIIVIDYHMARIIFHIVRKSWISFDAALHMMDQKETVDHETLARIMLECGFYVKSALFKNEADEDAPAFRRFSAILCPYDIPLDIVLFMIKSFIERNRRNRRGEPLRDEVKVLRQQQRDQVKAREESTQSYWQRQTNKDSKQEEQGGLADIGVVQGYWKKKEQREVGKLW